VVPLDAGDGDDGRRVEWVKPIDQINFDARRQGVFMLVDFDGRRLRFFGYDQAAINRAKDATRGRIQEMVNFLIARTRAEGETT
jgi:hypothetical protein